MASITIRNLSDDTKERLRQRAKRHGRSLEAELRAILDTVANENTAPREGFWHDMVARVVPGEDITEFIEENRKRPHRPVDLE